MPRLRNGLLLALLALGLWAAAAWLRLRGLDQVEISSDTVQPYVQALSLRWEHVQEGRWPRPPQPMFGDWLWLTMLPLVHVARGLQELFALRFILGAAIAPLGALAAFVWAADEDRTELLAGADRRQWGAAAAAGVVLAVDPGLVDTLVSGQRGYAAPELLAAATLALGLAWRGRPWPLLGAVAAMVMATGHHPFAFGCVLGLALLLPGLGMRLELSDLAVAAGLGMLLAVPRLLRLHGVLDCGDDPLTCFSMVAGSSAGQSGGPGLPDILAGELQNRFLVELGPEAAAGLGVGLLLGRPWTGSGALALGGLLGTLVLSIVTGYVQNYHFRILAAPFAVAAAVGLSRLWPLALAWAAACAWVLVPATPVGSDPGALARHQEVARAVEALDTPVRVERAWWGPRPALEPSAVVLAAMLDGASRDRFRFEPGTPVVLLAVGQAQPATPDGAALVVSGSTAEGTPWAAIRFVDAAAARSWVDSAGATARTDGAYDWAGPLYGSRVTGEALDW